MNFSSLVKQGYLRQRFITFLQQLNDYSENDVILQLMIFLLVVALHLLQEVVVSVTTSGQRSQFGFFEAKFVIFGLFKLLWLFFIFENRPNESWLF